MQVVAAFGREKAMNWRQAGPVNEEDGGEGTSKKQCSARGVADDGFPIMAR
jgi:hypothetical protein